MNLPEQEKLRSRLAQSFGEHSWSRYYLGLHSLVNPTFVPDWPTFAPLLNQSEHPFGGVLIDGLCGGLHM